ncbi:putative ammonia channel [Dissostichus eleginoides]|uniref:Ammonia channel n=1 Tax=Dissostichus eleginoides TaxID=100907 RepID=A0AAD9F0S4_DISEL|nr:putative ammonia channel [Dissostichus eleginoides]
MAKHSILRVIAIVLSLIFFIITMVFTALAGPGKDPFLESTKNISDAFVTEITPDGWTFTIWSIIYIFLALVMVYVISGIFRKNAYGPVYCSPAVLPHGFFVTWLMSAALAFLILIALTNYLMIFFSCIGLNNYGAWLAKYHKVDLWLHRVVVQNGIAIYATWTTIASLVNLTIVLTADAKISTTNAATISLSVLTVVLLVWTVLENTILDKHVRNILSIYPAVIWALTGVFSKNYNAADPSRNNTFIVVLLALACTIFAGRIGLVVWRHIKTPLYEHISPESMTPMEIADKQKHMFR